MKKKKQWKRIVDNKMIDQGDTDLEKKIIRVNRKKSKKKSSIIDTIVHEELHREHPKLYERNIRKKTLSRLGKMSQKTKNRLYSKYKRR